MALTMSDCIDVDWSCISEEELLALDPDVVKRAENFAQMAIKVLTGRQVGGCPITVRPCVSSGMQPRTWKEASVTGGDAGPYIADGKWYNSCSCAAGACGCQTLQRVRLKAPATSITSITLNGAPVPTSDYILVNDSEVVRIAGEPWPAHQDFARPLTEDDTFGITYVQGIPLDDMGRFCAGLLAFEYLEICKGENGSCRLPSQVVSVTRQGVAIELGKALFPGNLTGIREVDLWVATWNPYGSKARSRVYSPDSMPARRVR